MARIDARILGRLGVIGLVVVGASMGCDGHHRPRGHVRQFPSSTLGTDFTKVPRGQTIPPADLGVDLVHRAPQMQQAGEATVSRVSAAMPAGDSGTR